MNLKKAQSDEQKEFLKRILFNNVEAANEEVLLNAFSTIEQLSKMKATVKVIVVSCKFCCQPIKSKDLDILEYKCSNKITYFHRKCFADYSIVFSVDKCSLAGCSQLHKQQLDHTFKSLDRTCSLCKQNINCHQNDLISTGCQCPFKKVHKECVINKFLRYESSYERFKCDDCNSFYREENVVSALQMKLYGCIKCIDGNINHVFWDCVSIDCSPYLICRNCFNYQIRNVNFSEENLNQIKCQHTQNCENFLSFHTLNNYFYNISKVRNCDQSNEILSENQIDLSQYFKVAHCPGFIYKQAQNSKAYSYLSQDNITHLILHSEQIEQRIGVLHNNEEGLDWEVMPCNFQFELDSFKSMQRCPNCNYNFCSKCNIAHFSMPCSTYQKISKIYVHQYDEDDENFNFQINQYGNSFIDENSIFHDLQIVSDIINFDQNSVLLQSDHTLFLKNNPYECNYPNNYSQILPLKIEFLYGQLLEAYDSWLMMYVPIQSILQLRQYITCGIERNISLEFAEMIDKFSDSIIQYGTIMYSQFEYALDNSSVIRLHNGQNMKVILLCKVNRDKVKQPLSYQSLYIATGTDSIAYQILVFSVNS